MRLFCIFAYMYICIFVIYIIIIIIYTYIFIPAAGALANLFLLPCFLSFPNLPNLFPPFLSFLLLYIVPGGVFD